MTINFGTPYMLQKKKILQNKVQETSTYTVKPPIV